MLFYNGLKTFDVLKVFKFRIKKPGVLVELGFISNYNDRTNLQNKEYQIKISANIIKGIVKFFRNNY